MYVYEQKRERRDQGLGQTPPTPESREIALARALTNKYGVEFNSSRGQAVVVAKLLQDRYRPRSPQDPDQQKYDKTKIAAERIASPRPWTFDELRTVEYACDLYCRLGASYLIQNNVPVYHVPWAATITFTRRELNLQKPPAYTIEATAGPVTALSENLKTILHSGFPSYTGIQ